MRSSIKAAWVVNNFLEGIGFSANYYSVDVPQKYTIDIFAFMASFCM